MKLLMLMLMIQKRRQPPKSVCYDSLLYQIHENNPTETTRRILAFWIAASWVHGQMGSKFAGLMRSRTTHSIPAPAAAPGCDRDGTHRVSRWQTETTTRGALSC